MTPIASASPFKDACTRADGLPAIPLVLGVVGDAVADDGLRDALERAFQEFQDAYPNTPIVVMSALADAGERLAAETALARGLFVRVPLPSETARIRLYAFRDHPHADRIEAFVLPLPRHGQPPEGWDEEANAGGYLVRRCHALVAVCAGKPGTPLSPRLADFVAFKLEGKPFATYPWTQSHPLGFRGDRGPVILLHAADADFVGENPGLPAAEAPAAREVRVPTTDPASPYDSLGDIALAQSVHPLRHFLHRMRGSLNLSHGGSELRQFRSICQSVNDFNRDVGNSCRLAEIREQLKKVAAKAPPKELLDEPHASWLMRMAAVREAGGQVSQELQPLVNGAVLLIFTLLAGFLLCFHCYAHHPLAKHEDKPEHYAWFLGAALAFLLLNIPVVIVAWVKRLDERRLDYRALAESLRVRCSWALAGIGASVADSYLGQLRGEMIWARHALQHLAPPPRLWADQLNSLSKDRQLERLKLVQKDWVRDQRGYMHKAHKKEHALGARYRWLGIGLFALGVLGLIALLFAQWKWDFHPTNLVLIILPMVVIAAGLFVAYGERRSHEELAKQYGRMHVVFDDGDHELTAALAAGNIERAQAIIEKLGHEAISEHAQWLILRRARPVELQLGG